MEKKTPKFIWYDALKNEVEKVQSAKEYKISYKMKPEDVIDTMKKSGLRATWCGAAGLTLGAE